MHEATRQIRRERFPVGSAASTAPHLFGSNLLLCEEKAPEDGCIVEAGVWRGGMSAGLADFLPGCVHYLFDSFEGLPPPEDIDGEAALQWQQDVDGPHYFDNCRADRSFAEEAMAMARARKVHIVQGWFDMTVQGFVPSEPIAVLRLDGDWYDSTMQCLRALYPHVMPGGLIILDDYYTWDGCARRSRLSIRTEVRRSNREVAWGLLPNQEIGR